MKKTQKGHEATFAGARRARAFVAFSIKVPLHRSPVENMSYFVCTWGCRKKSGNVRGDFSRRFNEPIKYPEASPMSRLFIFFKGFLNLVDDKTKALTYE
jgi:hypothetical protein